jgi:hypothetical protein
MARNFIPPIEPEIRVRKGEYKLYDIAFLMIPLWKIGPKIGITLVSLAIWEIYGQPNLETVYTPDQVVEILVRVRKNYNPLICSKSND